MARVAISCARLHGMYAVAVQRADTGRVLIHHRRFKRDDPKAWALLREVRAAGEIDPAHWREPNKNGW